MFIRIALVAMLALVATTARSQTVEYIHTDALGSPVAITNASGTVTERSVYEPYGRITNRALTNAPGYTGHVTDAATGLTYMQQRYYDAELGRFLSVDPVAAGTKSSSNFNRYWYANDNPYRYKDPNGGNALAVPVVVVIGGVIAISACVGNSECNEKAGAAIGGILSDAARGAQQIGSFIKGLFSEEAGDKDAKSDPDVANKDDPQGALDSITKAQDKLKASRPSIQDDDSEFEGSKNRPKQSAISSTEKSKQRADDKMRNYDPEAEDDGDDEAAPETPADEPIDPELLNKYRKG